MPDRFVSPKLLWRAVMNKIVQDVPREDSFCEFECKQLRCTLETTGVCDIHPNLDLVKASLVTLTSVSPSPASEWTEAQSPASQDGAPLTC